MIIDKLSNMSDTPQSDQPAAGEKHLIGQLAKFVGFEPKTIRFYERYGLLSPKRMGRMRVYDHDDIQRLKLIKNLRKLGMTLSSIRLILAEKNDDTPTLDAGDKVENLLQKQLMILRDRQRELDDSIETLETLLHADPAAEHTAQAQ